jgi:pyridoxal phosphate enzyme (YggS family)
MIDDFEHRLEAVRAEMSAACERCGRNAEDVSLVAVSKKRPPESIDEAAGCGLCVFGENRVQEAKQKIPLCKDSIDWHMIGHLQTNKVRDAVALFEMIHSVDSLRLLEAINKESGEQGKVISVLLEVNVSGEGSKHGLAPDDVQSVIEAAAKLMHVDVLGLMTMPPFFDDLEDTRKFFRQLRELRDKLRETTGFPLDELSMGMSNDYPVAIEEGATMVRLGTILFGAR